MSAPNPDPDDRPLAASDQPTLLQKPGEIAVTEIRPSFDALPMARVESEAPPPLSRLGEYELLAELGRGGMGVVFKARHVRLGRVVALKMILGGLLARPEDLHRFENEAAVTAQLQHPNIVALYEVGTCDGQPFLSMEYVSGSSLAQRVAVGVVPGRLGASYLERIARAVHYAHQRGIIHRDLKPANVLLDEHDQPKVTDFGLAKLLQSNSGQTRTGAVLGTPSYMAPEQASARKDVGPACDVYSLGAILYELLTGHPPFRGETALATLALVANQEPVPPRLLNPGVDRDLETVCLKCLEKEPGRRYVSAADLADDLRRFLAGEPISARQVSRVGRALKWCRRKPATAALLSVTVSAVIGFALLGWRAAHEERQLREAAEGSQELAQNREHAMRRLLYLARMRQTLRVWESADLESADRLLRYWQPHGDQRDLRDWEWYYLHGLCHGRFTLRGHAGRANAVAFSPDGKRLASAGGQPGQPGELKVWDAATGGLLRTIPKGHPQPILAVAFSPDGNTLASAGYDGTVRLWPAQGGAEVAVFHGHTGHVAGVAFSPDGKTLASAGADHTLRLWDVSRATQSGADPLRATLRGHSGELTCVAFSPDGKTLASAGADETVRLWDPAAGQLVRTLRGHEGEVMSVAFSHTGAIVASGGGPGIERGQVKLWDVATGKALRTHYGLSDQVRAVAVSKGGKVAAGGSDGVVWVWDERGSSEATRLRADLNLVSAVAFSPDGARLASAGADGRVRLWNASGGEHSLGLQAPSQAEAVAFSPDGSAVASGGRSQGSDGEIDVWALASGERLATLQGHVGQVHAIAYSPDGKRLASAGDDRTVRVWDLASPTNPLVLTGHQGRVLAVAYHPRGGLLASAGDDGTVRLWDGQTGREERVLPDDPDGREGHKNGVRALAFSPDGRLLASGGYDKTVRVWDLETGRSFALLGHTGSTGAVAFHPDGTQLASGGSDRTVRIWDLASRTEFLRLDGSTGSVDALAYHPRGQRLASAGGDRRVRVWDLVTRQEILELSGSTGPLRAVAFSSDGRSLAAAGQHTLLRVWQGPGAPAR